MTDNVLSRLRSNRIRQVVPPRDDSLINPGSPKSDAAEAEIDPFSKNELNEESGSKAKEPGLSAVEELEAELSSFPSTKRHSGIVLETIVDHGLTQYCKDNQITVELFLEASWVTLKDDQKVLSKVLKNAQIRYKSRKEAGRLRRLITMLKAKK